jgi:hypothetical protein
VQPDRGVGKSAMRGNLPPKDGKFPLDSGEWWEYFVNLQYCLVNRGKAPPNGAFSCFRRWRKSRGHSSRVQGRTRPVHRARLAVAARERHLCEVHAGWRGVRLIFALTAARPVTASCKNLSVTAQKIEFCRPGRSDRPHLARSYRTTVGQMDL